MRRFSKRVAGLTVFANLYLLLVNLPVIVLRTIDKTHTVARPLLWWASFCLAAGSSVLAAGAWSRGIGGLPPDRRPPVRPVKGQMLSLRMDAAAPLLSHVLWAPGAYLVPRRDGRLIVGGTVEEKGFDDTITAGGMLTLLEAAWRAVPAIEELPIEETWVGHRPGSRDDAPILGRGPLQGLVYATGHHRNGILLAPVTADTVARLVLDDIVEPAIAPFGLERFLPARAAE